MERCLVFLFLGILGSVHGEFPFIPDPDISKFRQTKADVSYRLSGDTIPLRYEIDLEPNFEDFTFTGSIRIDIRATVEVDTITMHSHQLNNYNDIIIYIDNQPITVAPGDVVIDESDYQFLMIPIGQIVQPETEFILSMTYSGILNNNNLGFYRASYVEDGVLKWFATTQFAATHARQAFPCYDEPGMKATFKISIIRPANYHSISNTDQEGNPIQVGDKYRDVFEETDSMSTYLVALVVSELGYTERLSDHVVYATNDLIEDGRAEYALRVGIETMTAMEQFTGYPYSLSKMFQVAIPNDYFSFGAMENWGLVTYREMFLLYKEGISTASEEQSVASIIAHEYGHQWFGNLVTPAWWEYVWLSEGFATYFEYQACDAVNSEMRMMDQFLIRAVQFAMESDATESTRAMTQDAQTPIEILSLFDRVAYDKSGSVIRMMEHILTTDVYKRGLNIFLNEMEYNAAEASNLWWAIQEAVDESGTDSFGGRPVADVMETWELQAGFPVISATRGEDKITIDQERYFTNQPSISYSAVWSVPINYATASNPIFTDTTAQYWLTEASQDFEIAAEDGDWFILNKQATGYYRVNYDEGNWNLLIDYLNTTNYNRVHVLNRAQLVDDALNLARSGRLDYNTTMNLLLYLKRETDYIPLYSFFRGLTYLYKFILPTEQHHIFKDYMKEVLEGSYTALGTDHTRDTHTDKLNRINVLTWLCRVDHEDCVEQMHHQLTNQLSVDATPILPDLQTIVYCGGQKHTDHKDDKLEYLLDRYQGDEAEELEKNRILSAIGCSTAESILHRVLDIATGKDGSYQFTTTTEIINAFSSVYTESEVGLQVALDYIIDNFEDMHSQLTTVQVSSILIGISDRLTSQELMDKFNAFVDSLPTALRNTYSIAILTARLVMVSNLAWSEEHLADITDFLLTFDNGYVFAVSIPLLILTLLSHFFV